MVRIKEQLIMQKNEILNSFTHYQAILIPITMCNLSAISPALEHIHHGIRQRGARGSSTVSVTA
jgi:hypothetical protein